MQTLGKVIRRNPPTTGQTTGLKGSGEGNSNQTAASSSFASSGSESQKKISGSEISAANPTSNSGPVSLTGSSLSSSGWATLTSSDLNASASAASGAASQDPDATSQSKLSSGNKPLPAASTGTGAASATPWSQNAVSAPGKPIAEPCNKQMTSTILPAQEFPELGVEPTPVPPARPADRQPASADPPGPYGPGPSLRPATSSNWSQGSANAPGGMNGAQGAGDRNVAAGYGPNAGTGSASGGGTGLRDSGGQSVQRSSYPGYTNQSLTSGQDQQFRQNR